MSTDKTRLNISLSDDMKIALQTVAKRDQMPAATKAVRLMEIGMEVEEDDIWDEITTTRDRKGTTFHAHTDVFKN